MVQTVADTGEVGHRLLDIGSFLPRHSAGCTYIWLRDLGFDPAHLSADGGFPPQGDAAYIK